jgi:tripartite-type tricarboxylate transporter receptor subunit TctC
MSLIGQSILKKGGRGEKQGPRIDQNREETDMMASSFSRLRGLARLPVACALLQLVGATPLLADPVSDFYQSRVLTLLSGFTPNGENDAYLREVGRHIGRFIPGQPRVVPSNMPGAGTLSAANHIYNVAAPDGTVLGMFTAQAAIEPFLGNKAALFDPLKFGWIAGMTLDRQYCVVVPGPGIPTTFDELLQKETVFGSSAQASDIYQNTAVVKNVLGAKIKIVTGYQGMPGVVLALQRGEVSGACGVTATNLRTRLAPDLKSGKVKPLVQLGGAPTTEFGTVPNIFDYARTDDARELLNYFFRVLALGRVITAPPNVPIERLNALRTAFGAVLADATFIEEAKKLGLVIDVTPAADVQAQMEQLSKAPPEFFERVRRAAR